MLRNADEISAPGLHERPARRCDVNRVAHALRTRDGLRRARRMRVLGAALLIGLQARCGSNDVGPTPPPAAPEPVQISVPGFPPLPVPPDNPTTRQGIALGRRLFYDPLLSSTITMSCASCHAPAFAFTDHGNRVSTGVLGIPGERNAPALANVGWNAGQFWEGRRTTLEEQAGDP